MPKSPYSGCQFEGVAVGISTENGGNSQKTGHEQTLIDAISGLMADFLQLIDVNAGGLRLKRVQEILHLRLFLRFFLRLSGSEGPETPVNGRLGRRASSCCCAEPARGSVGIRNAASALVRIPEGRIEGACCSTLAACISSPEPTALRARKFLEKTISLGVNPQGPCHTKSATVIVVHYGGSKTLRQGL